MVADIPISEAPGMAESQASADVLYNEGMMRTSALGAMCILDRDLTAPPGGESDGEIWIPATTATGDWATHEGDIAVYYNGYKFISPVAGMRAYVDDEKIWIGYNGTEWHPLQQFHSTTETWTGRYCRQGQKIYCKTFDLGALPNSTTATTAHSITSLDLDGRILVEGWMENGTVVRQLPMAYATAVLSEVASIYLDSTNITVRTNYDATSWDGEVYIEYTRTA